MVAKNALVDELESLGIRSGACVLVRAGLRAMVHTPDPGNSLLDALLEVVGPGGTVVVLAHTGVHTKSSSPHNVMDQQSPAITGGVANTVLGRENRRRSSHPTHSIAAIGRNAENITRRHTKDVPCFNFVEDLLELDAQMLLVGCVWSGPGFSTTDYALLRNQAVFRTKRRRSDRNVGSWYQANDGSTDWFERTDDPGCSKGYSNLYMNYLHAEILRSGTVGGAFSLAISARAALEVDQASIEANPKCILCDDRLCYSCRYSRHFNKSDRFMFLFSALRHRAESGFKKITR